MKTEQVLIVEDDVIAQMTLSQMLEDMGFKNIHISSSVDDAVNAYDQKQIDFALLDVFLNGQREGIKVAEYITKRSDTPIIFLTASHDSTTFQLMKQIPNSEILEKPYDYDDISRAIKKIPQKAYPDQNGKHKSDDGKAQPNGQDLNDKICNSISIGLCVLDHNETIVKTNESFSKHFIAEQEDLIGLNVEELLPGIIAEFPHSDNQKHKKSLERTVMQNGQALHIALDLSNLIHEEQRFRIITLKDITPLKVSLNRLEEELEQNKTLRAEIQHRVKNSLNMVLGFLYMKEQIHELPQVKRSFAKLRSRIQMLARVHNLFFKQDFVELIHSDEFVEYLSKATSSTYENIVIEITTPDKAFEFNNDTGIKLGLVINELILSAVDLHLAQIQIRLELVDDSIEVALLTNKVQLNLDELKTQIGNQILEHISGSNNIELHIDHLSKSGKLVVSIKRYL
ncbi:MAG: response regulator [Bacteroidota bacterium]